jgi:hypothetical protein
MCVKNRPRKLLQDINSDGLDDFAIGAPHTAATDGGQGAAYVIFGAKTFPPYLDAEEDIRGRRGFKIVGSDVVSA